jgi:hypothetical protein
VAILEVARKDSAELRNVPDTSSLVSRIAYCNSASVRFAIPHDAYAPPIFQP